MMKTKCQKTNPSISLTVRTSLPRWHLYTFCNQKSREYAKMEGNWKLHTVSDKTLRTTPLFLISPKSKHTKKLIPNILLTHLHTETNCNHKCTRRQPIYTYLVLLLVYASASTHMHLLPRHTNLQILINFICYLETIVAFCCCRTEKLLLQLLLHLLLMLPSMLIKTPCC